MNKAARVITGWARRLKIISTSEPLKKLSDLRLRICGNCSLAKESKVLRILNGNADYEHQLQCTKCKCPCLEKSLVTDEKCPVDKW
jgi:hypothetical protein